MTLNTSWRSADESTDVRQLLPPFLTSVSLLETPLSHCESTADAGFAPCLEARASCVYGPRVSTMRPVAGCRTQKFLLFKINFAQNRAKLKSTSHKLVQS
jgi:hypothetical protein